MSLVSSKEFASQPSADAGIRKEYQAEVKADGADRVVTFTITTGDVDRDNDTIAPGGWDLSDYMKSPVVLWAHDHYAPPIAKAVSVAPVPNGLVSSAQFPAEGIHPFADLIYNLVKGGFIRACSVGFRAKKWMRNEERGGIDFMEQSLLEWSICPVPANPRALISASKAGIDLSLLKDWAAGIAKQIDEPTGLPDEPSPAADEPQPVASAEPAADPAPAPADTGASLVAAIGRIEASIAAIVAASAKTEAKAETVAIEAPDDLVLDIDDAGPTLSFSDEEFKLALRGVIAGQVREMAGATVRQVMDQMRGRVD